MEAQEAREKFVEWLGRRMAKIGRGDLDNSVQVKPSGKYWLSRIQSEESVKSSDWGDLGERLEPCAFGIRLQPETKDEEHWNFEVSICFYVWIKKTKEAAWTKSEPIELSQKITMVIKPQKERRLSNELSERIKSVTGSDELSAALELECEENANGNYELSVTLINTSPSEGDVFSDTRFYQCEMTLKTDETRPFMLSSLEDSFRYDRKIPAYGINCGIIQESPSMFRTEDAISVSQKRPVYWSVDEAPPSLNFIELSKDPVSSAKKMHTLLVSWGEDNWSPYTLNDRAKKEGWSQEALNSALSASKDFTEESNRIEEGISLLQNDDALFKAFTLMNEAMSFSANGKYDSWRSFQFGFLLANLKSIVNQDEETDIADVVWFATGGGKTETYLGLLITAALYDRLTGKSSGITAWSRFPLRMLSLQQTQRFANAIAAADIVRKKHKIGGARFSLGFLVGNGATPNSISTEPRSGEPDIDDIDMPTRFQVLDNCPYCHRATIKMGFSRKLWRLTHSCKNEECITSGEPLPIYIVDDEIYRFLPTIIVGTLDKAASISMQTAMRGLVGSPVGLCSEGHGYTYASRSKKPSGCLVPDCKGQINPLPMSKEKFGPSFRLQDELHLLRDSLGAVDAHYEALFDSLEYELCGRKPKILASSATLTGYEKQVEVLYQRKGRVFPVPPPTTGSGFWTADSDEKMRDFIAVAPKGVTIEYTIDRLLTELQKAIRELKDDPQKVCKEIGIPEKFADELISIYGTNVVYGNTIRDLEAVSRSAETQLAEVSGKTNVASLTGKTGFNEVSKILNRLDKPEENFDERLHILTASSMMSHGVDIDRLNVMVMLGIPLSTAEFIQATARVGRKFPALVFVIHKIGRERDAGVYRSFNQFIRQGDRFVDPIPISKRSRQVLNRTIPGMVLARLLMIHEYNNGSPLTTVKSLKEYYNNSNFNGDEEISQLINTLGLDGLLDKHIKEDIEEWMSGFEANIKEPPNSAVFPSELAPSERQPMRSLRDVEKQVPVIGYATKNSGRNKG
ncbi:C-terminal helicase domain-containing protein [Idiomarina abyssalis]|uniref:C-terminal helicase domain-containing protein n=1 Tax=Idiomarina abyssalis TaxID=86102 RepID=UPI003A9273CA